LPDYKSYGRYAPIRRNTDIINNSDYILALWDGNSKGTQDSIKKAKNLNKIVKEKSAPVSAGSGIEEKI